MESNAAKRPVDACSKAFKDHKIITTRTQSHNISGLPKSQSIFKQTRPDTRPPVADGWAGAEMRVFTLFDSIITDGRTDRRTKPLIELRVRN